MKTRLRSFSSLWSETGRRVMAVFLANLLMSAPSGQGYNGETHMNMVDLAYQIMRAATLKPEHAPAHPDYVVGPGISSELPPDWKEFLQAITAAVEFWRQRPAHKPPDYQPCLDGVGMPVAELSASTAMQALCHVKAPKAGGIFNIIDVALNCTEALFIPDDKVDYTGKILGYWAGEIDHLYQDTSLAVQPLYALGNIGAVVDDWLDQETNQETSFSLLSLLCLAGAASCLTPGAAVGCGVAWAACFAAAEDLGALDFFDNFIPLVGGDIEDDSTPGLWHFIQMKPGQSNEFDDHQGYFVDEAGPTVGEFDAFQLFLQVLGDLGGVTVDYDHSAGPKKYQILSNDGHENTSPWRDEGDWEETTYGHMVFEPIDNLAYYGWDSWKAPPHHTPFIGYVLHALGDAAAPHHVIGSTGWGHRPFEDAAEAIWPRLRFLTGPNNQEGSLSELLSFTPQPDQIEFFLQKGQASAILDQAFEDWKFIQAWRSSHPGQENDTPVRDLVTRVAQWTYDHCIALHNAQGWPYFPALSWLHYSDDETVQKIGDSIHFYTNYPGGDPLTRQLINRSVAATIAFLAAAPQALIVTGNLLPSVEILNPANNANLDPTKTVTLDGKVTDPDAVGLIPYWWILEIDGAKVIQIGTGTVKSGSQVPPLLWLPLADVLGAGPHTAKISLRMKSPADSDLASDFIEVHVDFPPN